jgi:hypothetical protein
MGILMGQLFKIFKRAHFLPVIIAFSFVYITTVSLLYWFGVQRLGLSELNQVKIRKQDLARSGAQSISNYFQTRQKEVSVLAEVPPVKSQDEAVGRPFLTKALASVNDEMLGDLVRIDNQGKVVWVINGKGDRNGEGLSVADRDYYVWAKTQNESGKVFLSDPVQARFGTFKNDWVVVMGAPVFNDSNEFDGEVLASFAVKELTERYVDPMVEIAGTKSYLVTGEGVIVDSNSPNTRGVNIANAADIEVDNQQEQTMAIISSVLNQKGASLVTYANVLPGVSGDSNTILASAPLKVSDQTWSLWLSAPIQKEEINQMVEDARKAQSIRYASFMFLLVIFLSIFIIGMRITQQDAYSEGLRETDRFRPPN